MVRRAALLCIFAIASAGAFAQTPKAPAFDIADVHPSPHSTNYFMQGGTMRGGRFEIHKATMVDLISTVYGVDAEFVLSGPAWIETDRFDIIAKAPRDTSQDDAIKMLQTLLADRFKLLVHKDTKPTEAFVLSLGKGKHKMKEAEGSGASTCQSAGPPPPPAPGTFPKIEVACRNMTMDQFATQVHQMAGGYLTSPVVNTTGLNGAWDFDLKWTGRGMLAAAGADGISIFDAVDRELGLKLELQKRPTPVIVVDSANEKPTPNPPGMTTALPPAAPAEFEVADIRPSAPGSNDRGNGFMPGGRVDLKNMPLRDMISIAWDLPPFVEPLGAPKWLTADSPKFNLIAKVATSGVATAIGPPVDIDDLRHMVQVLLKDRFKLQTHMEDRPETVYRLVAAKPKLRAADPLNRSKCKNGPATMSNNRDPGTPGIPMFQATCQNMTMALFAEQLQNLAPLYLTYGVTNATGIEGALDFTFTYTFAPPAMINRMGGGGREGDRKGAGPAPGGGAPGSLNASDPIGGLTLFDALEKQLGLKLEAHKEPRPVLVIDHIEPTPTEN